MQFDNLVPDINRPIVVLDADDVLVACGKAQIEWLKERYDIDINFEDMEDWWYVASQLQKQFGCSEVKSKRLSDEPFYQEGFFKNLKPLPGAVEGVRELLDYGIQVIIGTKALYSSKYSYTEKFYYFQDLFGEFVVPIVVTGDKSFIVPFHSIIVDDNVKNIERCYNSHYTFLFDRPWNQQATVFHERIMDWKHLVDRLKEMFPISPNDVEYDTFYNPPKLDKKSGGVIKEGYLSINCATQLTNEY